MKDEDFIKIEQLAQSGNTDAMRTLALMLIGGIDCESNSAEAYCWFKKAADGGDASSLYHLGLCCYDGLGAPKDVKKARIFWRKAADGGDADAMRKLGRLCFEENKTPDIKRGLTYLENAAALNDGAAHYYLGLSYFNGDKVNQDFSKAFYHFALGSQCGYADCTGALGWCYYIGKGAEKDFSKAAEFLESGANGGSAVSKRRLGNLYEEGAGVKKDLAQAVRLYAEAAKEDDAGAVYALGLCYAYGTGVNKDYKKAAMLMQKAASMDVTDAMYFMGMLYEKGKGVPMNTEKAELCYLRAVQNCDLNAKERLKLMKRRLKKAKTSGAEYLLNPNYKEQTGMEIKDDILVKYTSDSVKAIVPEGIIALGDYCFSLCDKIESATLPSTLKSIGKFVFYGCKNLNAFYVHKDCKAATVEEGFLLSANKKTLYRALTRLKGAVTIPLSVVTIEAAAFSQCESVMEIKGSDRLKRIGEGAFTGCKSLEKVTGLSRVKHIGDKAFKGCEKLKSIGLPQDAKIGDGAFAGCSDALDVDAKYKVFKARTK